jgi:cytochrome c oxidase subunit 2
MKRFSLFPEQASTLAPQVDALFFFLCAITIFFVALIAGLILVFMIRYRRVDPNEVPPEIHGSMALEVFWTAIPFAIVMVIFFWGASLYANIRRAPDDAMRINVVGKQWMWKMQHMEGRREITELHIPIGRPVQVTLTSEDVIHSFFVPAFRTKQDAVPGRYSSTWFEATTPGTYHLFCAEYCGTLHSGMIGRIVAMEPSAFQAWLAGADTQQDVVLSVADAGRHLFEQQGCASCHAAGATARGPSLAGLFGSTVTLEGGQRVVADENYLRESILQPQKQLVAGHQAIMPTYQGLLDEESVMQLIAYLKTLPAQSGHAESETAGHEE